MFNDVEHTFSDTKLSFHARRRFIVSEEIYLLVAVWHTRPDGVKVIPLACLKD